MSAQPPGALKPELFVSGYAAVLSTFVAAYQFRQWWVDRAKLKVEAVMRLQSSEFPRAPHILRLTVRAVNTGRRPLMVRRVTALLQPLEPALAPGVTEAISELALFGVRGEQPQVLLPDGGELSWSTEVPKGTRFLTVTRRGEVYGSARVLLTSGKPVLAKFPTISEGLRNKVDAAVS